MSRVELSARNRPNLPDVLGVLERMARATHTYTRDLAQYAMFEEIPFPHTVPVFPALPPVRKRQKLVTLPLEKERLTQGSGKAEKLARSVNGPHIEPWMPQLPSPHTYIATPVYVTKDRDKKSDRASLSKQRRQVERSLTRLKESQKVVPEVLMPVASGNPFLAPPKVGAVTGADEEDAAPFEPIEPLAGPIGADLKYSNSASLLAKEQQGAEQKRARVERILADAITGGDSAAPTPSTEKSKSEKRQKAPTASPSQDGNSRSSL